MPTERESWVVDRLEGDLVVLVSDDGETAQAPRVEIPPGIREGMVLRVARGEEGLPVWREAVADEEATSARLEEAEGMLEELRKRDPGGDIGL